MKKMYMTSENYSDTPTLIKIPSQSTNIKIQTFSDNQFQILTSSPATFLKEHEVIQPLDGAANSSAVKRTYKIKEALKREIEVLILSPITSWQYIYYEYFRTCSAVWVYQNDSSQPCSVTCGSGFRLSHAICVSTANYEKLPDKRCIDEELEPLPPKRHSCTLPLCNQPQNHTSITFYQLNPVYYEYEWKSNWIPGDWSSCSASCNIGIQTRIIQCADESFDKQHFRLRENEACNHIHVPESVQFCNNHKCPSWHSGQWTACSVTCGKGWQRRVVDCRGSDITNSTPCNKSEMPSNIKNCSIECNQHFDISTQSIDISSETPKKRFDIDTSEAFIKPR